MAHHKDRSWFALGGELAAALYDALSLQAAAVHNDSISLLRRMIGVALIGLIVGLLFFLVVMFMGLAIAGLIAPDLGWPLSFAIVGLIHLLTALGIILYFMLISRKKEQRFALTKQVFEALQNSLITDTQKEHNV
jgi:hypothetical protein